jgi:predicted O-linked N-acetylglucosamine transferase (SPINDLY family)
MKKAGLEAALELQASGRAAEALDAFLGLIAQEPDNTAALYSAAALLFSFDRTDAARGLIDRAAALKPGFAPSWVARSKIRTKQGELPGALDDAVRAFEIDAATPDLIEHLMLVFPAAFGAGCDVDIGEAAPGTVLQIAEALEKAGAPLRALAVYQRAITRDRSDFAPVYFYNSGVILQKANRFTESEICFRLALLRRPAFAEAHLALGLLLETRKKPDEALAAWSTGLERLAADPAATKEGRIALLNNLGRLREIRRDYAGAEAALHESLLLDHDQSAVLHHWVHLRQKQCRWPVEAGLPIGRDAIMKSASPLAMLGLSDDPHEQFLSAKRYVDAKVGKFERMVPYGTRYGHDRLRIGYLSSDLSMHAVSLLTVELFETHHRDRVEVHAFCWSKEDGTPFRERVRNAFDVFHKIGELDDLAAAELIKAQEIDVLVDLHGLTANARPNIVARGPAPVQIAYLGFPGPSAIPYVDHVIADDFLFPEELRKDFSEVPLYIPRGFQVSDSKRPFGPKPARATLGLPEDAFVFCAFNNNHKITPEMFACWLRILKRSEGSVLWLLEDNPWSKANLLDHARNAGVDPDRLRFAGRIDPKDYLARFQAADLFLDTTPYNAGTTANDALWAGLPILTLSGRTYVSRMAGALLESAGLDEFIAFDRRTYEEKAVALRAEPARVRAASRRLSELKARGALFDTETFCTQFEDVLEDLLKK